MVVSIIILLFLIGITYRKDVTSKPAPGKPAWYAYRKILALLIITILPVLLVNDLLPEQVIKTADDKIKLGKKEFNRELIAQGYRELAERYPDSLELQFQNIDMLVNFYGYKWNNLDFTYARANPITKALMKVYIEVVSDAPIVHLSLLDPLPPDAKFVHYVRGLAYKSVNPKDYNRIRYHVRREVVLYPDSRRGWEFLWILFRQRNQTEELDALMQNPDATRFLPAEYREDYYFEHEQWENYAAAIIETRVLNVGMLTLVSAFLVSFVWLVFLRSMDIFNRENWWNIALIFIAGAGFTHFCLPVYDYARLVLDFRINGEWWNDLLYCIAVIGGGEELVKMIPWALFALFSRRFREPYDYLLYASVSALGFAFMENLMYLEDSGNIVARSIMSAVGHMFNASVIAYGVILAKYRFKILFWRIAAPVFGFILAAVCHGFYDFWLLSPSAEGYYFVTFLFFLFSLHIWFFFKNNAMNNSGFFTSGSFNAGFQQDLLTFSILSILILEFVMISLQFGTREGNQVIGARALIIGFFLIYMSVIIHKIELKQGVWRKWRFSIPRLSSAVFRLPYGRRGFYNHEDDCEYYEESTDLTGLQLRLFAPKSNKYIGDKLPKSGMLVRKVTVSNDPDWYVLQLNSPIHYNNYVPTHIIVKNKHRDELLNQPKIEIYFMFIPDIELLRNDSIDVRQLRYAGRAYAMPVNNARM